MEIPSLNDRLLLLARVRLKHRPFEFDAFETELLLSRIVDSHLGRELLSVQFGEVSQLVSTGVPGGVDRELINIIDRWASLRVSASVEPLPPPLQRRIPTPKVMRPPPVGIAQRNRILQLIRNAGHDPKALPARPPGKAGIKAAILPEALAGNNVFGSAKVFNTVWQKLRDEGEIQD